MDIVGQQRSLYETLLRHKDAPFITERPAMFSPAAAVQDDANAQGVYGRFAQILLPMEYTNWAQESAAHAESCYIGDWTSLSKVIVRGRQAHEFLSWVGMNDLSRCEIGQIRHHVQLDQNGWVASEGVLCRLDHDEFLYTAGSSDWLLWQFGQGSWDAEISDISPDQFIFAVQGPGSLFTLEKVTGESLRDIRFNRSRAARIGGSPVRVLRTGISGELGYELHGSANDANAVWSAVVEGGAPFGIRLLGFRSQSVQHIEAGIATNGLDYLPASIITPGAPRQFRGNGGPAGSFVPSGVTDYFRKPGELGWGPRGQVPAHDFLGRDALLADAAHGGPSRVLVGLLWNSADVIDVFASLFRDGDIYDQMELPRRQGPAFDQVRVAGSPAGVSTGRTVSPHLRAAISLCVIDREHSTPGTSVVVVWGRPGGPQREIAATVAALPFKPDRRRADVNNV
jgi:glycine cleavage system aminomethyltransferase T